MTLLAPIAFPRSKAGWILAALYLVVSIAVLYQALTCSDGFFCGIKAIPMLIPAGVAYLLLFVDYLPSPAILQWPLVVPTLATNVVLYYLLGSWLSRVAERCAAAKAGKEKPAPRAPRP